WATLTEREREKTFGRGATAQARRPPTPATGTDAARGFVIWPATVPWIQSDDESDDDGDESYDVRLYGLSANDGQLREPARVRCAAGSPGLPTGNALALSGWLTDWRRWRNPGTNEPNDDRRRNGWCISGTSQSYDDWRWHGYGCFRSTIFDDGHADDEPDGYGHGHGSPGGMMGNPMGMNIPMNTGLDLIHACRSSILDCILLIPRAMVGLGAPSRALLPVPVPVTVLEDRLVLAQGLRNEGTWTRIHNYTHKFTRSMLSYYWYL
ncbi:hypothetical protein EI94DRAFT_734845, partial [Lactarius quietus]